MLEAGVREFPQDVFFSLSLARLCSHMGQHRRAGLAYLSAIRSHPDSAILVELERVLHAWPEAHSVAVNSPPPRPSTTLKSLTEVERFWGFLSANERYPAPYYGFAGRPNGVWEQAHYDDMGFPNPVSAKSYTGSAKRVFVLGDSCVANSLDGSYAQTLPGLIQEQLRVEGIHDVQVFNFGVLSFRLEQMLSLFLHVLVDLKPDAVMILAGGNDVVMPVHFDPRPGYPYNFYAVEELYDLYFGPSTGAGRDEVELQKRMSDKLLQVRHEFQARTPGWLDEHARNFVQILNKLAAVACQFGVAVDFVFQPLVASKEQVSEREQSYLKPETFAYMQDQQIRMWNLLCQSDLMSPRQSEKFAVHNGMAYVSGTAEDLFSDYIHYNRRGTLLMANKIASVVSARLAHL